MPSKLDRLLKEIRACQHCANELPLPPQPILAASTQSRILLIGQAPGRKTRVEGTPFSDASGDRLREWLGVTPEQFYDRQLFAIVPMGFCFPGSGKSGDLPPPPACAPLWHTRLLQLLKPQLILLIGRHAIDAYVNGAPRKSLKQLLQEPIVDERWPLPHPSPRNNIWLRKNPSFEAEVVPALRQRVAESIS